MYTLYRRKKKIQKQKLDEYAESQLVYRIFQTWYQKFETRVKLNELESDIVEFRDRFLVARVFNYWKSGKEFIKKIN